MECIFIILNPFCVLQIPQKTQKGLVVFFTESYFKKNWFLKIPKLAPRVERSSFCFLDSSTPLRMTKNKKAGAERET